MRDQAIFNTHNTVVSLNASTEARDSNGNLVTLDESKISAEISRLQAEYDRLDYSRKRKEEYANISEQLDMLYWDQKNGTTIWQNHITEIKNKYPKS